MIVPVVVTEPVTRRCDGPSVTVTRFFVKRGCWPVAVRGESVPVSLSGHRAKTSLVRRHFSGSGEPSRRSRSVTTRSPRSSPRQGFSVTRRNAPLTLRRPYIRRLSPISESITSVRRPVVRPVTIFDPIIITRNFVSGDLLLKRRPLSGPAWSISITGCPVERSVP